MSSSLLDNGARISGTKHRKGGSPISSLSEELLSLIIDTVREEYNSETHEDIEARLKVAITASHVSRLWRFIALGHPLWWTQMAIYPPWNIEPVEVYFHRSQQCPLDVWILGEIPYRKWPKGRPLLTLPNYRDSSSLFKVIAPHLPRCRTLYIDLSRQVSYFILEELLNTSFPLLEKFLLQSFLFNHHSNIVKRGKKPLFAASPLLRDLRLIGVDFTCFTLPSVTLSTLHLARGSLRNPIDFEEFKTTLEHCPKLTMLALYDNILELDDYSPNFTYKLPSLEYFYLLGNIDWVSKFLLYLEAQNLKDLVIGMATESDLLMYSDTIKPNASQHFPKLRMLTLAPATPTTFVGLMNEASVAFPQVQRLILANSYCDGLFRAFTDSHALVFPGLQDLALTNITDKYASTILAIEKFRYENHVPILNLILDSESFRVLYPDLHPQSQFNIIEGNLWEDQRRSALYSEIPDLFTGRVEYK